MQCASMARRRKLTMNWEGLGDDEEDDRFFETRERISCANPLDLASDMDEFEDSRMSFTSTISSASSVESSYDARANPSFMLASYDMWTSEPGDIRERRKRLLQGMGLASSKDMLRMASTKTTRAKVDPCTPRAVDSASPSTSLHPSAIVFGRSRSDSDIDVRTRQRKEELVGSVLKQRLIRTSSAPSKGLCQYSSDVNRSSQRNKHSFDSFFLIKNLDTGKEFIVKEYNEEGMWNKLSDVETGKQLTIEEFEKAVGQSRVVKELMRRQNKGHDHDARKLNHNKYFTKSFRNSKRKGAALLKNIKVAASSKNLKEHEQQQQQQLCSEENKAGSQWVKTRQHGKSYREFTALHVSQEIQAHEGSIWVIRFSKNARFLATAGEDKLIHVWEVQDCEIMPNSASSTTPVHPMTRTASDCPQLADITPMPSKKKSIINRKKANSIPDYVNVPETVFALSEKPLCTFQGHQDDVLDLSWSTSQLLLSSSMDKTVRLWDLETKSCLKTFAHNDYDDDYFISGSLDAKVRIWNVPDRQVVDWSDSREMVTAASYTPDGQGAVIGSQEGMCRFYSIDDYKLEHTVDIQMKTKSQAKKLPGFHPQAPAKKITGFQYAPWNQSEVLITSTDSRIRIYNGEDMIQKFRGSRNTCSQSAASFSPDGRHVISASEDSQVYIWKVGESKNPSGGKKSKLTVKAYEHFHCKDVTVAVAWPGGSTANEPPSVEIHSKRHSKLLVDTSKRRNLPPLPKKNEDIPNCEDDDHSPPVDPGIGVINTSRSLSASVSNHESPPPSALGATRSQSLSSHSFCHIGGQTAQATAWGMVIVTASLEGEIRVYQNFGLPRKVRSL
ncbi:WD repeat-containing protein 44-like isoform X2 [Salvia hispanica]|uniref:WD repeat-containing protein 44-like isoform X2 n=1 Tax=Salvia hispanica TaxID=49212 RepID=UPI0020096E45|nr:WD repeat-containing protein 44-like isoform X2 [Salvia hispanica]